MDLGERLHQFLGVRGDQERGEYRDADQGGQRHPSGLYGSALRSVRRVGDVLDLCDVEPSAWQNRVALSIRPQGGQARRASRADEVLRAARRAAQTLAPLGEAA